MAVACSLAPVSPAMAGRAGQAAEGSAGVAGDAWRPEWFRACAAEIRVRIGPGRFREGVWFGEGTLLLVTPKLMLAIRPWGESAGAWSRAVHARVWERARPYLDLGGEYVGEVPPPEPPPARRPRERRRGSRRERAVDEQYLLPFPTIPEHARHNERVRALAGFFAAVPVPVREQAIRLRPGAGQWSLLPFLSQTDEPGLDLCRSNLPLAFMLAECHELGLRVVPARIQQLVRQKQHLIVEELGFPGEKCVVRILRKLPDPVIDVETCRHLRRLMRWRACREAFGHLPVLSPALLRALRQPGHIRLAAPALLGELARSRAPDRDGTLVADTLAMLDRLRRARHRVPAVVRGIAEAQELHDRFHRLLAAMTGTLQRDELPPPPLPGIPASIEPIRSGRELLIEGTEMHHCVGSYLSGVRAGRYSIYRVLSPQRATLALRHTPTGWQFDQIRGPMNRPVAADVRRLVDEWLATELAVARRGREYHAPMAAVAEPVPDLPVDA